MDDTAQLETLMRLDLLKPVPEDQRQSLAETIAKVSDVFEAGPQEVVLHEGHLGFTTGYVLLSGEAEVVKDGRSLLALKPPTLLGEMSQFHNKDTRMASVKTAGDCVFLQFDWTELHARAREDLGGRGAHLLKSAVERLIWKRFGHNELLNLPLFHGLGDELAYKVCVVFPWLSEKVELTDGAVLFHANTRCQGKGHLLVRGRLVLQGEKGQEKTLSAPDVVGVLPKSEPKQVWSSTCTASGEATVLAFGWPQYISLLQERLSADEQQRLVDAFKTNAAMHFQS